MSDFSLEEIINHYRQAIILNPSDARAHHHLAMYYAKKNDDSLALAHFDFALKAEPGFLTAHYHAGIFLFEHRQWEMAKMRFLSVLELDEKNISAHFYMGVMFFQEGELDQAEKHFNFILEINPDHIQALINLGALALKRDAGQIAIAYFTQVLILDEKNLEARRNLAATFLHYDRFENALTHYDELQRMTRLDVEDYYNMGVATMALGRFSEAISYYGNALEGEPNHGPALNNLATIYIRLGNRENAISLLQHALKINPQNLSGQFMLNVLRKKQIQPEENQAYIKNLFNQYAFHFDQHLQRTLQYTLPEQSFKILSNLHSHRFQKVIDLGCGTGLSGILLREYCEQLTGVDLSAKMLGQARIKKCYDYLIEADIVTFLQEDQQCYDLVQALDVLPYFGDLEKLFSNMIARLSTNGWLMFSAEISHASDWMIQDSMRFCHSVEYIQSLLLASTMELIHCSQIIARQENEQALPVLLMIYRKSATTLA